MPGNDGEPVNLLEIENKKAVRHTERAVGAVKLRILDDFMRRQMDKELSGKVEKASRIAKQLFTLSVKTRTEQNLKGRDEGGHDRAGP